MIQIGANELKCCELEWMGDELKIKDEDKLEDEPKSKVEDNMREEDRLRIGSELNIDVVTNDLEAALKTEADLNIKDEVHY